MYPGNHEPVLDVKVDIAAGEDFKTSSPIKAIGTFLMPRFFGSFVMRGQS
jgi:hypothetical protein